RATPLLMDPLDAPWQDANLGSLFPAVRQHSIRTNLELQSPVRSSRTRHSSLLGTTAGATASRIRHCHTCPPLRRLRETSLTRVALSRSRSTIRIQRALSALISSVIRSTAATVYR